MKIRKKILYLLSAAIVSPMINIPIHSYSMDMTDLSNSQILFQDDFEGYSEGFGTPVGNYGKAAVTDVEGTTAFKFYGVTNTTTTAGYSEAAEPTEIMQTEQAAVSGIGEGSSLMITAQSGVGNNQLIRDSGINSDAIAYRCLVFTTKFKVPSFVGFGDGVGVYLASKPTTNYEPTSGNVNLHLTNSKTYKDGELIYLGARPGSSVTNGWAYNHIGKKHNQLWTFGEKVADLQAGEEYTYTVTMTPNASGAYDVTANLNGTEYTLGQEEYASSSSIPTVEEMAAFAAVRIMRLTHAYYFNLGHTNVGNAAALAQWLSSGYGSGLGITTNEGLYDIDRPVAYFDDMLMCSADIPEPTEAPTATPTVEPTEVPTSAPTTVPTEVPTAAPEATPEATAGEVEYFSDDFESYTAINGLWGWSNNKPAQYDGDKFKYFYAEITTPSENHEAKPYFGLKTGTPSEVSKIETNTGVGSGNALKITGQLQINHYTMLKSSGVNPDNSTGKQIVFETSFKAPNPMTKGEGFGVWTFADANEKVIAYVSDDLNIIGGTGNLKNELLFVSTRVKSPSAVKIYAFGEEVATVDHNTVYNYKLTLTPDENGGYTATVTLNGETKTLIGTNLPTQEEFGTYNRVHLSPVTHEWQMWSAGFERSYNNVPEDVKGPDGMYEQGRTLGIVDNISLKGCDTFELDEIQNLNSSGEIPITSSSVTLKMTGEIKSFDQSKLKIDNNATVTAKIDENDASKLVLNFGNLKSQTKYKINIEGLLNNIKAEYVGTIELMSSNGVDILPVELNGSADGVVDRVNPNTVKVSVQKHSLSQVINIPAVIVFVSKEIDGVYKNVKTYYSGIPITASNGSAEITGIEVGEGEVIRVFIWNDNTHMKPLTNVIVFE